MERMNLLLSKSGSVSQKEMEAKVNAVKSQISATILSKISQERFEWQPSISAESAESFKISNLNEAQVNLLQLWLFSIVIIVIKLSFWKAHKRSHKNSTCSSDKIIAFGHWLENCWETCCHFVVTKVDFLENQVKTTFKWL